MTDDLTCRNGTRRLTMWCAVFAVCLLGFLAYKPTLGYFFTGTDTLTLIETSSLSSWADLQRTFTEPLMHGTSFVQRGKFYRPLAVLSYSLDQAIWALNPFGYHLTDLVIHLLVVALVAWLMWFLTGADLWVASTAAGMFAIHPILVESVPAPALRHDSLAALFLIVALLIVLRSRSGTSRSKVASAGAVCGYVLALGAKETAICFPCLLFVYHYLFSERALRREKLAAAAKGSTVFFITTAGYLIWRIYLLGGVGGYQDSPVSFTHAMTQLVDIVVLYFHDLLYPQDLLNVYAVLSQPWFVSFLAVLTAGCVAASVRLSARVGCSDARVPCFLAAWLCLPLALFVLTATFSHRNMYVTAIPFSGLLSWVLVNGLRHAKVLSIRYRDEQSSHEKESASIRMLQLNYCVVGIAALILVSLLASSPLVRTYPEVKDSASMSWLFFKKLGAIVHRLPASCTMHVYNLPETIRHYRDETPKVREVGYLSDYSIKSWLNLHYPGNHLRVVVHTRSRPERLPRDLSLATETRGSHDVRLFVSSVGTGGGSYLASNSSRFLSSRTSFR